MRCSTDTSGYISPEEFKARAKPVFTHPFPQQSDSQQPKGGRKQPKCPLSGERMSHTPSIPATLLSLEAEGHSDTCYSPEGTSGRCAD